MSPLFRPLWKLLLRTAVPDHSTPLTCADCFTILEYLADIGPEHKEWPEIIKKARRHLSTCPGCQAYYEARLNELETMSTNN